MRLIVDNLYEVLEMGVAAAKKSIMIISPYIKTKIANQIIELIGDKQLDLKLLTLSPGEEYITGATDVDAIIAFKNHGFEIRMLPSLHAKVYLIDEKILLLGSANFTNNGFGLAKRPNKEILFEKKVKNIEIDTIINELWNHEEVISIDRYKGFEEQARLIVQQYQDSLGKLLHHIKQDFIIKFPHTTPHEQLLMILKENDNIKNYTHIKNGFLRHAYKINDKSIVKIMRSKEGIRNQAQGFNVFNYQITEKSAHLFIKRKVKALILILEEQNQFVCLPTTFLLKNVIQELHAVKSSGYQFKIKRKEGGLILSIKGKGPSKTYSIKHYEGKIGLKYLKP